MKLWILFVFVGFVHCTHNVGKSDDDLEAEEQRVADGGNYGGFIGLTMYGAGPFAIAGFSERDGYGQEKNGASNYEKTNDGYGQRMVYDDRERVNSGDLKNDNARKDSYENNLNKNYRVREKGDSYSDDKKNDTKRDLSYNNYGYRNDNDVRQNGRSFNRNIFGPDRYYGDEYTSSIGYGARGRNQNQVRYRGYGNNDIGLYCGGDGRQRYGDNYRDNKRQYDQDDVDYDEEMRRQCDYLFGYTGPTANDEPENLIRPCRLDDLQCIRKFFAANSQCKPAYGPMPDPLYINIVTVFYPAINATAFLPNLQVRGLSTAKITEFYVNKISGNLVIAIDVQNLQQTMPRAYIRYRRKAKESIVLADYATVNYGAVTFTAVIPNIRNLRLDLADIHADNQDSNPPYFLGPGASNSTDPDVVAAYAQLSRVLSFEIREGLLFQAPLLTSIYIQENICDFGLKLTSV